MKKEKGLTAQAGFIHIILIIVVVVAIIAVVLFFGKDKLSSIIQIGSPVPTAISSGSIAAWKTYTSKSGNTTIAYPSDWAYREFDRGVAFYNIASGDTAGGEPITLMEANRALNDVELSFSEYVKVAAAHEIQNFESLSTINPVITTSGVVGYTTTWKVSPIPGSGGSGLSESLPITYFEIPNVKTSDMEVSLESKDFLNIYNEMIKTFNIKKQSPTATASNMTTYTNSQYHFEISFPNNYKALTDSTNLYGWPNAVVLIYKGGQSYDLPIEVWNTPSEYLQKYPTDTYSNLKVFSTKDGKYITLANVNKDPEVTQIVSTFKFTQ